MRFIVVQLHRTSVLFPLTFISLLLFISSGSIWASEWLWQADNHAIAGQWETSKFTDGVTELRLSGQSTAIWTNWWWDDPYPGTVTFRHTNGWMAGGVISRGFADSSDFGEAFDIDQGITVAARVRPIHAHSQGTLCISAANTSTQDLPGESTYVWVGWVVPDEVRFYNTKGKCLKRFKASVDYDNRWSIWTFSAKQIGDTVAWDLWIDEVHQGADQIAPDGTKHTLVYTEESDSGNRVRFGQRMPMLYPHETAWDYLAITNDGVIPGWSGNATPANEPEQPKPITEQRKNELLRLAIFKEYMKAEELVKSGRYSDVLNLCEKALVNYKEADPGVKKVLWFKEILALTLIGEPERAVKLCDELLEKYPDKFDPLHLGELRSYKVNACERFGQIDEAAKVIDDMLLTLNKDIAASNQGPVIANPGFEEVAQGNNAPGWGWYCTATASFRSETSDPYSGSRCIVFTNASEFAPEVYGRLNQVFGVFPATEYEISLWVKGEEVASGSHLTDWYSYQLNLPEGTFDWKKVTTTFTTKDAQNILNLGINVVNKCKTLAIDDITVRPVGTPVQVKRLSEQRTTLTSQKAYLYYNSKRYREAANVLKDELILAAGMPDCLARTNYMLGLCHKELGELDQARYYLSEVKTKFPTSEFSEKAEQTLSTWSKAGY